MKRIRARRGTVLVSMLRQDTSEDGQHYIDPNTGLFTGREVHQPVGVVVASGVDELPVGCKVITMCDLGEQYRFQGMTVQLARVEEPCKCGRPRQTSELIAAYKTDQGWAPAPGRLLLQLVEREAASDTIEAGQVQDQVLAGTDTQKDRIVYFKPGSGLSWREGCTTYISIKNQKTCQCGRPGASEALAENEDRGTANNVKKTKVGGGQKGQKRAKNRPKTAPKRPPV